MFNTIAIIIARGGSKRIPRKNIKDFCGKPMIQYAIESVQNTNCFDEIMVSTDDDMIAEVSKKLGASVPFKRSDKNSDDNVTTSDVLLEVIDENKKRGKSFGYMCCVYPCVPFLKSSSIKKAFNLIKDDDANAVIPVCEYPTPIERSIEIKEGYLQFLSPSFSKTRTQDLVPKYFDSGQFYFIKTEIFLKEKTLMPDKTVPLIIPPLECQDIDTPRDWEMAELKYKILNCD
jgi:N-acylneuraminate cytidylyltransferase